MDRQTDVWMMDRPKAGRHNASCQGWHRLVEVELGSIFSLKLLCKSKSQFWNFKLESMTLDALTWGLQCTSATG